MVKKEIHISLSGNKLKEGYVDKHVGKPDFLSVGPGPNLIDNKLKNPVIKIIVVEDNWNGQSDLKKLLALKYSVISALDGQDAFEKALSEKPDLIIADIKIGNMNGFELSLKIRQNKYTRLVPIILLTSGPYTHNAIFAMKAGADDCILKPFHPELLLGKISVMINSRKLLKDHYSKKIYVSGSQIEITPFDERFVHKCINIIEENLLYPNFSGNLLAGKLFMSRSSLYRKLKRTTGYSINNLIRKIRLDRAKQLLKDGGITIHEIANTVGFSDVRYFRSCFVEQFGTTPSRFRKTHCE